MLGRPSLFKKSVQCPLWVKADICAAKTHVRFTPNSDRKSEFPLRAMSALPPKADKSHEIIKRVSRVNQAPGKVFRAPFRHTNAMCARRERQMPYELDSSRLEQVIMLGGLALFLVLATVIPA